jgi:hypothetical protein
MQGEPLGHLGGREIPMGFSIVHILTVAAAIVVAFLLMRRPRS